MYLNKFRILVYLPCTVLLSLLPPVCVQCALRSVYVSTNFHEIFNILRKWVFKHDESIWSQDVCQVYSSTIFVFHHPSVKISPEKCPHFRRTHHIQKGKGAENIFDNYREISLLPLLLLVFSLCNPEPVDGAVSAVCPGLTSCSHIHNMPCSQPAALWPPLTSRPIMSLVSVNTLLLMKERMEVLMNN